jgi:hypothetical protein
MGLYFQDRIEYDFITVRLGFRYDLGEAGGLFFANPLDPTAGTTAFEVCQNPEQWQGVTVRTRVGSLREVNWARFEPNRPLQPSSESHISIVELSTP